MSGLLLQILCLMFVSACFVRADSADDETDSIIGGTTVVKGQYKYMALILKKKGTKTTMCGGTIISSQHILTAAHCFEAADLPYDSVAVHVNDYNNSPLDSSAITRSVLDQTKDIRKHAKYDKDLRTDDIAIVKLDRVLTTAELTNVAIVSVLNTTLTYAGSVGVALGWGVTKSDFGTLISRSMQQVSLNIQDDDLCDALWETKYVPASHLCTFTPKKAVCWGDDGGPILVNGVQVGISSFSKANAAAAATGTAPICERGSVFTRVSTYVRNGWIQENLLDPIDISK
ncbi:hypothetical protein DAPPUDRAFT_231784 [Daphnia pulex]|uniref:Peptidase S1 domain-containing protein n=1 Tax=Daphnia pulex TaxID=6669 RepID=E9HK73_DAPPU|nr:hypothetical protein DAPPUDRAFT_231784 [Daphnia pulex]|eukprot:EFX67832.1 hypothetical protein DAPPUDRAFT_231784 [Daphnia pulex]